MGSSHARFSDFLILSSNFGMSGQYTDGDFDKDGHIQFSDFLIQSQNFGQSSTVAAAPVPEPSTVVLALLGVVGLLTRRRR